MQERDEDLAWAYNELDELEKVILKKNSVILKMGITIGILGLGVIAFVILKIKKIGI